MAAVAYLGSPTSPDMHWATRLIELVFSQTTFTTFTFARQSTIAYSSSSSLFHLTFSSKVSHISLKSRESLLDQSTVSAASRVSRVL